MKIDTSKLRHAYGNLDCHVRVVEGVRVPQAVTR